MIAALAYETFRQPTGYKGKIAGWLMARENKARNAWMVEQLNVQPYQHILEVGYGPGNALQHVAGKLKVGFLAGIDHSLAMYQQAYRKNKSYIEQQLLHLHFGDLHELSYPPHYFHTIYGSNVHFFWKDPQAEFIRLSSLLKSKGKLVMVFQPRWARQEEEVLKSAEKLRKDFIEAGLTDVRIEYREMYPVTCISAVGIKA